jgi:arylsulfatase A-like enzyme
VQARPVALGRALFLALGAIAMAAPSVFGQHETARSREDSATARSAGAQASPPNIVAITVDTLRWDGLGCNGSERARTPRIDSLASAGTNFLQATTPFPRTTPALASLFTGLLPHRHGSREVMDPLLRGATLADLLSRRGYRTIGVSANHAAGPRVNLHRGFAEFFLVNPPSAEVVTARALSLSKRVDAEEPLLLWVHYFDPHFPYLPPATFRQPEAPKCRNLMERLRRRELEKGAVQENHDGGSAEALEDCEQLYDSEVAYTDVQIGLLLDGLGASGRLENAVVVFTSDHGENLGEAGLFFEHGPNVHDASMRVPLIIAGPGLARNRTDRDVARLEDLMPTLLALADVDPEDRPATDGLDLGPRLRADAPAPALEAAIGPVAFAESGSSLVMPSIRPLVTGRARERHCINGERFSLCQSPGEQPVLFDHVVDPGLTQDVSEAHPEEFERLREAQERWPPEHCRERTVRTPRFKLVEYPLLEGGYRRALYDLGNDPRELRDVSQAHPEVAATLGRHLDRYTAELPAPATRPPRSFEQDEILRSLGYVE